MVFDFNIHNQFGSIFLKGNVVFSPDCNKILSPFRNKINIFDVKETKSFIIDLECNHDINLIIIDPMGSCMLCFDDYGIAILVSLITNQVILKHNFMQPILAGSFSPDSKYVALAKNNILQIFNAPGLKRVFNPFISLRNCVIGSHDISSVQWSSDSKFLVIGSNDTIVRIIKFENEKVISLISLNGHSDSIINAFFFENYLNCISVSKKGAVCFWKASDDSNDEKIKYTLEKKEKFIGFKDIEQANAYLVSAAFNKEKMILASGFSDGSFYLHKIPEFILIQSTKILQSELSNLTLNSQGDWIAFAGIKSGVGEILIWDWDSEIVVSHQKSEFSDCLCVDFSPDGNFIATAGNDSLLKLWNVRNGFCFKTFNEHKGPITGCKFSPNGEFLVSCSLDGTVKTFDLKRYRNFRTFTTSNVEKLSCLAIDPTAELIAAASSESFDIFIWAIKTGHLLEKFSGHDGPVTGINFTNDGKNIFSSSWDSTIKLWEIENKNGSKSEHSFGNDKEVTALKLAPDQSIIATAQSHCQVTFLNPINFDYISSINVQSHLKQKPFELSAKMLKKDDIFITNLCFSSNSEFLIICSNTPKILVYSVSSKLLVKEFLISESLSHESLHSDFYRSNFSDLQKRINPVFKSDRNNIPIPGLKHEDKSLRKLSDGVSSFDCAFSPIGRSFCVGSSNGAILYSKDLPFFKNFNPDGLQLDMTPDAIDMLIKSQDSDSLLKALITALSLDENELIIKVIAKTPFNFIKYVSENLNEHLLIKLLDSLAYNLDKSRNVELILIWIKNLLTVNMHHLLQLAKNSDTSFLDNLIQKISNKRDSIKPIIESNLSQWNYLSNKLA